MGYDWGRGMGKVRFRIRLLALRRNNRKEGGNNNERNNNNDNNYDIRRRCGL